MPLRPPIGCFSCKIQGRVIDNQSQKPLGGVDIEWDLPGVGFFRTMATTDSEGKFTTDLAPIPGGESRQIIKANDKDKEREQVLYPTVSPNVTVEVNFTLGEIASGPTPEQAIR